MSKLDISQSSQKTTATSTERSSDILQRKCALCGNHTGAGGKCEECKNKQDFLQRKSLYNSEFLEVPPIVNDVLRSPGTALDPDTRAFMESRFRHDFSHVRLHTDAKAAESAEVMKALAYTVGSNIVFGPGQYIPHRTGGRELLVHELTHVVQQARGDRNQSQTETNALESEADRNAANFLSARVQVRGSSRTGIARKPAFSEDISKLDDDALRARAVSLTSWFGDHLTEDPDYSDKLEISVSIFQEISVRSGSPASAADVEALKKRLVASSPRTEFERRCRRGEFPHHKPVYDNGEIIGYSYSSSGYSAVVDLDGNTVWSHEKPLETPLLDPTDLIPFELIGSLAAKAAALGLKKSATLVLHGAVIGGVKLSTKDAASVLVKQGTKAATLADTRPLAKGAQVIGESNVVPKTSPTLSIPKTKADADAAAKLKRDEFLKSGRKISKFVDNPHDHHLLPEDARLQKYWDRLKINNQDPKFKVWLNPQKHLKDVHGGHSDPGGLWNATWLEFFDKNPNATVPQVMAKLAQMRKSFGI